MVRASRLVVAATASLAAYSSTSSRCCHAMSEYMARSHEEKLRAIRDVEMKKNAVIEVRGGGMYIKWGGGRWDGGV